MQTGNFRKTLCAGLLVVVSMTMAVGQKVSRADSPGVVPAETLLRILRAEDERRRDGSVTALLGDRYPIVRKRAALALGRIGDERDIDALVNALKADADSGVRQMAAFAIGEIESPAGADALIAVLDDTRQPAEVRVRAVEALGKIAAVLLSNSAASATQGALSRAEDKPLAKIRLAILDALKFEAGRRSMPDRLTILLGLTAALRAKLDGAGPVIIEFLGYSDPRIVADALNTMARLRLKDNNEEVRQLLKHADPIVRANAARVIGAAEDKGAFDALLDRALHDDDLRVRVSAIRALGSLKDGRATQALVTRGISLLRTAQHGTDSVNELVEIASSLGRLSSTQEERRLHWFMEEVRALVNSEAPEVEIALAKIIPDSYEREMWPARRGSVIHRWRQYSSHAQGLATVKTAIEATGRANDQVIKSAQEMLRLFAMSNNLPPLSIPDVLKAYASYGPADLPGILIPDLTSTDVIVRSTAAELLGDLPPDEANRSALITALKAELPRIEKGEMNDAALAILDELAKQKTKEANEAIKTALDSSDHLIRRRAVALLKANGVGDFSDRIGTVKTRNTDADYRRAIARIGRKVSATVVTSKGAFTIEFLPEESPLTVDNFVQLARKGYFNGQTVPRVVPNFVIQTGDPRGDQNGGPGYQIRCEINEAPYERGAVGMALSGKDTGGSQWFVTHSPQPHLDGGYTVFGRVIRGMDVVDSIARGDTILRVVVNER